MKKLKAVKVILALLLLLLVVREMMLVKEAIAMNHNQIYNPILNLKILKKSLN